MKPFLPKTIRSQCVAYEPLAFFEKEDSPWFGYPYKWKAQYTISTPQLHAMNDTQTPYEYNGLDVVIGDWLAGGDGFAVKVSEVVTETFSFGGHNYNSPSPNAISLIVEDVETYNLLNDPSQGGVNFPDGQNWIFSLSDEGIPMLNFIPSFDVSVNFYANIMSRFQNRNLIKTDYLVQQSHSFSVGDIIYITNTGTYDVLTATSENKDKFERIVGQVTSIGSYGANSFTYRPRGNILENITPPLPGTAGSVVYLDPSVPGGLTDVKPSNFAFPLYIRLETANRGIYLTGGGGGGGSSVGPLGYNATVYRVPTLTDRDALDATQLKVGDQIFVIDSGEGEWAMYMYTGSIADVPQWIVLVDQDSSTTDARTITVDLFYTQSQPLNIWRVGKTSRISEIIIDVTQTFHSSATLTIGDDSVNNRLMGVDDVDLNVPGTYVIHPSYQYNGTGETQIKAYYTQGSSTQGSATITITYI